MDELRRLHLGASSLELLAKSPTKCFINSSWVHLGDLPDFDGRSDVGSIKSRLRNLAKRFLRQSGIVAKEGDQALYSQTEFRSWIYNSGDSLNVKNDSISFIYSEHVFEHFRFDIAVELFSEAYRVLAPGGVIRTVVPDSDYRTYEAPEPAGYPGAKLKMNHPNKHKTRWNKYLLEQTLQNIGFETKAIAWCDDEGIYHTPQADTLYDKSSLDYEMTSTLQYVQRPKSLIIDGIK